MGPYLILPYMAIIIHKSNVGRQDSHSSKKQLRLNLGEKADELKDEVAEIGAQLEREMKRERDVFGSDVRAYAFAAKKQVGLRRDAARELQERETDRLRRGVKRSMKSDVDPAVIAEAKTTFETTEGRKVTALSAIQQRLAKQKVGQKAAKGLNRGFGGKMGHCASDN